MSVKFQRFCIIRHGETDANRDAVIAGRIEAQLTDRGRAAARALAGHDWPAKIALFSSPQDRARETAALGFPGHPMTVIDDLRERSWGPFEGRPVAELPNRFDDVDGVEAWGDLLERVEAALNTAIVASGDALPVLVAHSGVVRAARALTGGAADGPSAPNATPILFHAAPHGWQETRLD